MSKITYLDDRKIKVYLDKMHIGNIRPVSTGGWSYYPKNSPASGEVYNTIAEVKRSLEGET